MAAPRYDALVVGAGPAGSVAALVLARGGARVALVDKARFPRDKACGDLVGPRGVRVLDDLGLTVHGPRLGDMEVVGPAGHRVLLPARDGLTYPGYGIAVSRRRLDEALRTAAVEAGAEAVVGRAGEACFDAQGRLAGFRVGSEGADRPLLADAVIGADGALSRVGAAAGLVDDARVLWGFAVRGYVATAPRLPEIHFWEPVAGHGYPGYGWWFPGEEGHRANVGLGVGVPGDRRPGARAARDLDAFLAAVGAGAVEERLGGWLKMGMVGTTPAAGRTLLVGDAAGLVNPLQGEGIAAALSSGRAAAEALLAAGPDGAAARYRAALAASQASYAAATAPITAWMLRHPRAVSRLGRLLTVPRLSQAWAPAWALYWNELLPGASPGPGRGLASVADRALGMLAARGELGRSVRRSVTAHP
ncbi:MAG TPA: geranylgeranyl reductase family protein [Acidimicrobiales bacterium]|nr:geranylgeranyl reductase family protein [Acidimicrobiales bacterium]